MNHSEETVHMDLESKKIEVNHTPLHYFEQGQGDPILFLHSVPASAWIWRDVIPHLSGLGRCIALDLPGFGQSGKPNTAYSLKDQIKLLDQFIEALHLNRITFILHGWGSILGLDYAMRHEKKCKGIAFYEAWLCSPHDELLSLPYQEFILHWQSKHPMQEVMTNGAQFVNHALQQLAMQPLAENSMAHYCAAFLQTGVGNSLHQFLEESPNGNGKNVADKIIENYSQKLCQSKLPKLLMYSIPGFVTSVAMLVWAKAHLSQLEVAEVGEDFHFAPESHSTLMGETISIWLQGLEA